MTKHSGRIVNKPWGHELWIADGVQTPYALKRILFKANQRSSLQVHQYKFETNFVLSGRGIIELGQEDFPCEAFLAGELSSDFVETFLKNMVAFPLAPGDVLDVTPGRVHRVIAEEDLTLVEASTPELDDVIRLFDDSGRGHGKIPSEHAN